MSKLKAEELQALSVPQLKKYAAGVEGEDLELVNSIIASKETRKDKLAQEANEKLAELQAQRAQIAEAEAAMKAEALKAREELKEAQAQAKAEAEELRLQAKQEAIAAKEQADALKAEVKAAALLAKAELDAAKAEEKQAKLAAKEEAEIAKLNAKIEAQKLEHQRFIDLQAEMQRRREAGEPMPTTIGGTRAPGENQSETIRQLYAQGLSNKEISEASGIPSKRVTDTVWGIKKKETEAKFLAEYRAKKAVETLAAASAEEVV